ncbi:MAG: hypothetical protein ABJN22_09090 [Litorimonas sp.]
MGDNVCLLNLDTGDYIDLGGRFLNPDAVPQVGYEGQHYLLNSIPSIPYSDGGNRQRAPEFQSIMSTTGHALNAFLAASIGCRLITLWKSEILNRVDALMETNGYLADAEIFNEIVGENGEFISEGTQFYRQRLSVCADDMKYKYSDKVDQERIERKKIYYEKEVQRALDMNKIYKSTGVDQESGKVSDEWVYSVVRKPSEPTL